MSTSLFGLPLVMAMQRVAADHKGAALQARMAEATINTGGWGARVGGRVGRSQPSMCARGGLCKGMHPHALRLTGTRPCRLILNLTPLAFPRPCSADLLFRRRHLCLAVRHRAATAWSCPVGRRGPAQEQHGAVRGHRVGRRPGRGGTAGAGRVRVQEGQEAAGGGQGTATGSSVMRFTSCTLRP